MREQPSKREDGTSKSLFSSYIQREEKGSEQGTRLEIEAGETFKLRPCSPSLARSRSLSLLNSSTLKIISRFQFKHLSALFVRCRH